MSPLVRVIVVGAGCRGEIYSRYSIIHPDRVKVVGVADPRKFARTKFQHLYNIAEENLYEDWRILAEREKCADAVLICTPDVLHKEPAVAFAKKGYHVLLEKPMATTAKDCIEIVAACSKTGVMLCVGHVLRYDPYICKIKELIDSGVIGDVIHIQHLEPVGFFHFAHSYVRGNWRNEAESSFSLLAKSCHDIDLILHWAGTRRCLKVTSFGFVSHFSPENKPAGAGDRCLDCSVEDTCPYSASKIYLDRVKQVPVGCPLSALCPDTLPDIETVSEALRTGPYGRCVYECDNDVCSNQFCAFDGPSPGAQFGRSSSSVGPFRVKHCIGSISKVNMCVKAAVVPMETSAHQDQPCDWPSSKSDWLMQSSSLLVHVLCTTQTPGPRVLFLSDSEDKTLILVIPRMERNYKSQKLSFPVVST